jgi:hypothetical protein
MQDRTYLVLYQIPGNDNTYSEITSNIDQTISWLESQGYIIIDIIDI